MMAAELTNRSANKDPAYLESIDDLRELLQNIDDGTIVNVTLETGDNND